MYDVIREINRIKEAEEHVKCFVNAPLLASDTVDAVYKQGLRQLGYTGPVHAGAGRAMFELQRRNPQRRSVMALDAAQQRELVERFPGIAKLKLR